MKDGQGMSEKSGSAQGRAKKQGGVFVPHQPNFYQRAAAMLIYLFVAGVSATVRYRSGEERNLFGKRIKGTAIYCVWHNRLALCLPIYWKYAQPLNPTAGMAAMASASKDGAFLAAVIECFKVHAVRGSSSRRGHQALLELTSWAERGYDLAITPDGPRGPRYKVQPGVISLAQVTGLPIVPASYNLKWKIQVKSWDRFQIPLPFSRCDVCIGTPLVVPRDASDAEREKLRAGLEAELLSLTRD
jgi:lysophospholipid acyltransferase (LPLAT)-like uncharacterized protein